VPRDLDAAGVLATVGPLADAIAVVDDSGRYDALYEQGDVPVLTVRRNGGGPLEVLAHLYRWYMAGQPLRGCGSSGAAGPRPPSPPGARPPDRCRCRSHTWVSATSCLPHCSRNSAGCPAGEFRRLRTAPDHDVDATPRADVRTLACTIAAVLEFTQP
jgi:hypothetical protein